MDTDRATKRYRAFYATLLRFYPETFRSRFAVGMEQTFHDLCRERQADGRGLLAFALGLFAETSAGIFRERLALMMIRRKSLVRLALATASILSLPLVAMQFTDEVDWDLIDFVAGGALLFGAGLAFELVAKRSANLAYRFAIGLAVATALLLVWVNLAVGLIGSEDNPANLMYLGVLAVGTIGACAARFRPRGMALALYATAFTQALVPVLAMTIWRAPIADGETVSSLTELLFSNAFFVLLFVVSAFLFRRALASDPKPI